MGNERFFTILLILLLLGCQPETAEPFTPPSPTKTLPTTTPQSIATNHYPHAPDLPFMRGVDVSILPMIERCNGRFYHNNIAQDGLEFMAAQGVNFIRLRVWVHPANGASGLDEVLSMAQRAKSLNLGVLIDFHYSDSWADPSQQTKPAAWADLSGTSLETAVTDHTRTVITALYQQGTPPDIVQLGNEITNGILWPDGRLSEGNEENWSQFAALLRAGSTGVASSFPNADQIPIMLHIDSGGNQAVSHWFFDHIEEENVLYDMIGLSFYPWWHGSLEDLQNNMTMLVERYDKPIVVVETAYPWTLSWQDDTHNLVGLDSQLHIGYPASVDGQAAFLGDLKTAVQQLPNNLGAGFFYWAPDYISTSACGSVWENLALFDFNGESLPAWHIFAP